MLAEFEELELELLTAEASCDALLLLLDFDDCEAFAALEFADEFADLDAFAAKLLFELKLLAAADWLAAVAVAAVVPEALLVELAAAAPLDAPAALFAEPEVVAPLLPTLDGLLNIELLVAFEVPPVGAEALSAEPALLAALLLVLPLFAAALKFAAPDFTSLALFALLDVEAFVDAFDLFELLEADAVLVLAALLLALWFAAKFLLAVEL